MKKILSLTLALALLGGTMIMPAYAADSEKKIEQAGGSQTVPVVLTVQPAVFSVTVPTNLPVYVGSDGTVTTAGDATIQNESAAPVVVTDIDIIPVPGWELIDFTTDPSTFKFNEHKLGLQLNGTSTGVNGTWAFDASKWTPIAKQDTYTFTYDANLPPQAEDANGTTMANVVFTVGWAQ